MLPRLRPPFSLGELLFAVVSRNQRAEKIFERKFAEKFGFPCGLFFSYGRSALYALLKVFGWQDEVILVPAYTCAVVPHAIVISGNRVRFMDCELDHFNVSSASLTSSLDESIKMVIPTPLFGYPVDRKGYEKSILTKTPQAFILYDVAHSFGVQDHEGLQTDHADGALFGLGIGKVITTLYGGMLLLRDEKLCKEVIAYRDRGFLKPGPMEIIKKFAYGVATWVAFREPLFSLVDYLERNTTLLYHFTDYYYGKSGPTLPTNFDRRPTQFQSRLGLLQLDSYDRIIEIRRQNSLRYEKKLREAGFFLFSSIFTPTYSHFPLVVKNRKKAVAVLREYGIQVGYLVDYSCPDLPGYEEHHGKCPNSYWFAQRMINLPNWPGVGTNQISHICNIMEKCLENYSDLFYLEPFKLNSIR